MIEKIIYVTLRERSVLLLAMIAFLPSCIRCEKDEIKIRCQILSNKERGNSKAYREQGHAVAFYEVVIFLAKQEDSFRGHHKSIRNLNKGKFRELL